MPLALDELQARIAELEVELEQRDIELALVRGQGPLTGLCSWCGLELYGGNDPAARIKAHLAECPTHPMRGVEAQRDALAARAGELAAVLRDYAATFNEDACHSCDHEAGGVWVEINYDTVQELDARSEAALSAWGATQSDLLLGLS